MKVNYDPKLVEQHSPAVDDPLLCAACRTPYPCYVAQLCHEISWLAAEGYEIDLNAGKWVPSADPPLN